MVGETHIEDQIVEFNVCRSVLKLLLIKHKLYFNIKNKL